MSGLKGLIRGTKTLATNSIVANSWVLEAFYCRRRRRLINNYFKSSERRALHIGCGAHLLDGWLNADFIPRQKDVIFLNAVKRWPFPDESFDYVFSEHMIEHITQQEATNLLQEAYRVLRGGGRIRMVTPDLKFLFELLSEDKSVLQQRYLEWASANLPDSAGPPGAAVVNNFFRSWGHQFIYDEKTMIFKMLEAGFRKPCRYEVGESPDVHLCNLENINRMPNGFLALESMVLEASKCQ